jgi:hypothetical protein
MLRPRHHEVAGVEPEGEGGVTAFALRLHFHRDEGCILDRDVELLGGRDQHVAAIGFAAQDRGEQADHRRAADRRTLMNQVPSRAIRISLSPQCVGFHLSTGGRRRSSARRAISASERPARSAGGSMAGIART